MKCPVCCEDFSGGRCPHCGMRVGDDAERRLFPGEESKKVRSFSGRAARPVQRQPVRRNGKISLAALERRQEASRKSRRALAWIVAVFMVIMVSSFLLSLLDEVPVTSQPEAVAPASETVYGSPYAELELELENWAAHSGRQTLFFYMEEDNSMYGVMDLDGVQSLAEAAASGDGDAQARWGEAEEQCALFYQEARAQMDEMGRTGMQLSAWLSDPDSGELVLAMDGEGVWYSYYEDLLAGRAG